MYDRTIWGISCLLQALYTNPEVAETRISAAQFWIKTQ
jgi:hypothetical protein